jgi:hypothetical protein
MFSSESYLVVSLIGRVGCVVGGAGGCCVCFNVEFLFFLKDK